jgi:TolB-like protein
MNIQQRNILFYVSAVVVCLLIPVGLLAQEAGKTVAILPFQLNAPPENQYLSEGLRDMLGSRLRAEAGARIVAKGEVQSAMQVAGGQPVPGKMAAFAEKVGADHLIYGTITALGGGVSIDAKVYTADVKQVEGVQDFYGILLKNCLARSGPFQCFRFSSRQQCRPRNLPLRLPIRTRPL